MFNYILCFTHQNTSLAYIATPLKVEDLYGDNHYVALFVLADPSSSLYQACVYIALFVLVDPPFSCIRHVYVALFS